MIQIFSPIKKKKKHLYLQLIRNMNNGTSRKPIKILKKFPYGNRSSTSRKKEGEKRVKKEKSSQFSFRDQ